MTVKEKTFHEKMQESIDEIRSMSDLYLAHDDQVFCIIIWGSGYLGLYRCDDSICGLPEVYFGICPILPIPACLTTDTVADFVEENSELFETVREGSIVFYENGNKRGRLTAAGQEALEELGELAEALHNAEGYSPTAIFDPEMMFEQVEDELGDVASPEEAVKLAMKWAEEGVEAYYPEVQYLIDHDLIREYATEAWHKYHGSRNDG